MEIFHDGQLTIYNDPKHFLLYNLIAPEKVNNFQYTYGLRIDPQKFTEEEDDYLFNDMIEFCGINALLAPASVAENYFNLFSDYIKDKTVCDKVVNSMDQWSVGFIAMWDYDFYKKGYKLLISATDDVNNDPQNLVTQKDKQNYQFTAQKALPRDWAKVNLTDIIHLRTGVNFYAQGDGNFLIHALHKLDKKTYEIGKEKGYLEESIKEQNIHPIKAKL